MPDSTAMIENVQTKVECKHDNMDRRKDRKHDKVVRNYD
jgi:hypothetical protein